MGDIAPNIIRQCELSGEPLPQRIANAPKVKDGLEIFWNAYIELDSDRSHSMGPTRISWSSIARYCEFHSFSYELSELMFYFVRKIDDALITELVKKNKEK